MYLFLITDVTAQNSICDHKGAFFAYVPWTYKINIPVNSNANKCIMHDLNNINNDDDDDDDDNNI